MDSSVWFPLPPWVAAMWTHITSTSLNSWVGNVGVRGVLWGGAPSESHLSLKAIPNLGAVCRALYREGRRQGNGGRTCQLSHCARNTYWELYWETSALMSVNQQSPVTGVYFKKKKNQFRCRALVSDAGQLCLQVSCLFMITCAWMLKRRLKALQAGATMFVSQHLRVLDNYQGLNLKMFETGKLFCRVRH